MITLIHDVEYSDVDTGLNTPEVTSSIPGCSAELHQTKRGYKRKIAVGKNFSDNESHAYESINFFEQKCFILFGQKLAYGYGQNTLKM